MVCTQFSTQRNPDPGYPKDTSRKALLTSPKVPCTSCPNQRVTSQTFYCCDTCFRGSLHPAMSLRSGATLSTLVLAELPTVIDFCVVVCGLDTRPFSCFISVRGPPPPRSCFPLCLWALSD